jgi:hypothetical protein
MKNTNILLIFGAIALLLVIFGIPAVLVPAVMNDVPDRSMTKVMTNYQEAANVTERTFAKHRHPSFEGRLTPLPTDTRQWIELINPMGRKAPGGGPTILPTADPQTGAIGLEGDDQEVVLTIPPYRDLIEQRVTIWAKP